MRQGLAPIIACLAAGACAAAAPARTPAPVPPPTVAVSPTPVQVVRGGAAAQAYAADLLGGLARRVVEVEEHHGGLVPPGGGPGAVTLFEAPHAADTYGLCQARAHLVMLGGPAPGSTEASAFIRTGWRFRAVAPTIGASAGRPAAETQPACAALRTATDFFATDNPYTAKAALEALEHARLWAADPTAAGAVNLTCEALGQPCDARRTLAEVLRPDRIAYAEQTRCEPLLPAARACWRIRLRDEGGPGIWSVLIRGPQRPMHVLITQDLRPVA